MEIWIVAFGLFMIALLIISCIGLAKMIANMNNTIIDLNITIREQKQIIEGYEHGLDQRTKETIEA